ncbi:MAG: flagellar hook-length control protein FliK, partial [Firmicutes bacterium]|nr:flagellar hook-length control protein FliK [Bacillota bacterium]
LYLNVEPKHLGRIAITLTAGNGEVNAQFLTGSVQAKEAIESSLTLLRESLQVYGMHLGETTVSLHQGGDGRPGGGQRFYSGSRGRSGGSGNAGGSSPYSPETDWYHGGERLVDSLV